MPIYQENVFIMYEYMNLKDASGSGAKIASERREPNGESDSFNVQPAIFDALQRKSYRFI